MFLKINIIILCTLLLFVKHSLFTVVRIVYAIIELYDKRRETCQAHAFR